MTFSFLKQIKCFHNMNKLPKLIHNFSSPFLVRPGYTRLCINKLVPKKVGSWILKSLATKDCQTFLPLSPDH